MFVLQFSIQPIKSEDEALATIKVETLKNDVWTIERTTDVSTKLPEAEGRLVLENNQRVTIETRATTEYAYDPEQKAVVQRAIETQNGDRRVTNPNLAPTSADTRPIVEPNPAKMTEAEKETSKDPMSPNTFSAGQASARQGASSSKDIKDK